MTPLFEYASLYLDRVRLYGHAFNKNDFSNKEQDFIAHNHSLFTIEKRHAHKVYGRASSEKATLKTAQALKKNSNTRVLFYWNADLIYNSLYSSLETIEKNHPTWVKKSKFNVSAAKNGFDFSQKAAQKFWVKTASDIINDPFIDGAFIDAVPKAASNGQLAIIQELMDQLPGIVIYNGFRMNQQGKFLGGLDTLEHADGVFVEAFMSGLVQDAEKAEMLIDELMKIPADKYLICNGLFNGFGSKGSHQFSLAAYLILANDKTFYRIGEGHQFNNEHLTYWHEDFEKKLGPPKAKAIKKDGIYRRSFEHAEVELNLKKQTSSISWLD